MTCTWISVIIGLASLPVEEPHVARMKAQRDPLPTEGRPARHSATSDAPSLRDLWT